MVVDDNEDARGLVPRVLNRHRSPTIEASSPEPPAPTFIPDRTPVG
jgi:hypothetical protein